MQGLQIVFRVDASVQSGAGHVMRCLTLANALRSQGAICRFVCRAQPGDLIGLLREQGHDVLTLAPPPATSTPQKSDNHYAEWLMTSWETDAEQTCAVLAQVGRQDWMVVDHYALDAKWERSVKACYRRLLVVDDLADREHDCDLLVDQNLGRQAKDYDQYLPPTCTRLIGPNFALLRPSFAESAKAPITDAKPARSEKHILISLGGVDKDNITEQVLDALHTCNLPEETRFTVVLGSQSPWLSQVQQRGNQLPYPTRVLVDVQDMPELLADIDLAIGAAGVSALERCCMGVPTLLIPIAANQWPGAVALAKTDAVVLVAAISDIQAEMKKQLPRLILNETLLAMSIAAKALCDGRGCSRVVAMMDYLTTAQLTLRPAQIGDALTLFRWANDALTRANALSTKAIVWSEHLAWLEKKLLATNDSMILMGELPGEIPYGQIRFDRGDDGIWMIDYSIAPEFRYLGLGRKLLQTAVRHLGRLYPQEHVIGRVKPDNLPSSRVFESLGFQNTGLVDDLIVYKHFLGG